MNGRRFVSLIIVIFSSISAGQWSFIPEQRPLFPTQNVFPVTPRFIPNGMSDGNQQRTIKSIPFPECLASPLVSSLISPESLKNLFDGKLREEEARLVPTSLSNNDFDDGSILKFHDAQLRADVRNGPLLARTATKLAEEILARLSCQTNAAITADIDLFLKKIRLPPSLCAFRPDPNCEGSTVYRTASGVCNNLINPYQGSARTAFGRILPAAYDDGLQRPRSLSVLGGPLLGCREISSTARSNPIHDKTINHLWVIYGQFTAHDITMAVPLGESGRTAITTCTCDSQGDDMCNIIDIPPNDSMLAEQKCINMTATAQAFSNKLCTLSVKEQMNGNSHYIDLSPTYGSTERLASNLRTKLGGLMKIVQTTWSKFELPPGQRESRSCADGTPSHRCFGGGDSRIMENIVVSGIQAQWLRAHNRFAVALSQRRPDWQGNDELLYQETRKIQSALHQHYIFNFWLPILIGPENTQRYVGDEGLFSQYDPRTPGVVFNDVVTGVLRLHTFVRNSMTRCRPNGDFIDEHLLKDVTTKCKFAYDVENNGIDAFLCGAMHDYGYSGNGHYSEEIHHNLFERMDGQGQIQRNDILAMNICRAREHGIAGYNAYRAVCGLPRVKRFEDFADVMTSESIQKLTTIYRHPDDVDLLIGANHEQWTPGGVVGTVSACLIGLQFRNLKYGDRLFFTHEGQFTPDQLTSIKTYPFHCFMCHTMDIERVARNPFRPANDMNNPSELCSQCPIFDFTPWRM